MNCLHRQIYLLNRFFLSLVTLEILNCVIYTYSVHMGRKHMLRCKWNSNWNPKRTKTFSIYSEFNGEKFL